VRLQALDHESFFHLIVLLEEAGLSGVPVGGNELVVPDDAVVADPELRAEMARVLVPGTAMVASDPGGSDPVSGSASDATGVAAPAQTGHDVNPPAAPMSKGDAPGIMGPTDMKRPPTSGPGSNMLAQRRYATSLGLQVSPDLSRDEIIALIDQHLAEPGGPSDG
jgi:hypothetical protein